MPGSGDFCFRLKSSLASSSDPSVTNSRISGRSSTGPPYAIPNDPRTTRGDVPRRRTRREDNARISAWCVTTSAIPPPVPVRLRANPSSEDALNTAHLTHRASPRPRRFQNWPSNPSSWTLPVSTLSRPTHATRRGATVTGRMHRLCSSWNTRLQAPQTKVENRPDGPSSLRPAAESPSLVDTDSRHRRTRRPRPSVLNTHSLHKHSPSVGGAAGAVDDPELDVRAGGVGGR